MATGKASRIAGWVLSVLLGILLIGPSAGGKFTDWPDKKEMFDKMGFTIEQMYPIGVVEVVIAILFLIPRTGFIGAILLTAYLGGATVTHVRVHDAFHMPIIIGILVWVGLGLRQPAIFNLALGKNP